jgi:hypothetical protein
MFPPDPMNFTITLTVAWLALLRAASFAQDFPAQPPPAQDIQQRAEALLDKARQLSDIRSPNAPAFRLKATFSFTGDDLETVHGTYAEVWVSSSQWRSETVIQDRRRLKVADADRIWQLDSTPDFPEQASRVAELLDMFPRKSAKLEFESIFDHPETHPPAQCAVTQPDASHRKSAFCVAKKDGVLLERIFPEMRPGNVIDYSCDYGLFYRAGNFWLPQEIACFEDRHRKFDVRLVDLSPEPAADPVLFTPPPEAIELGNCPVAPVPPRRISSYPDMFNVIDPDDIFWTTVWFVVDRNGMPQHAKLARPTLGNKAVRERILRRVRDWRFKPATCNGVPMPMPLSMQIPS